MIPGKLERNRQNHDKEIRKLGLILVSLLGGVRITTPSKRSPESIENKAGGQLKIKRVIRESGIAKGTSGVPAIMPNFIGRRNVIKTAIRLSIPIDRLWKELFIIHFF